MSVIGLIAFLIALALFGHFAFGCYGKDGLPPCPETPGACGDYPSSPSFMHKRDGGQ